MKVGDLVEVNKRCDAGGLWGARGIVTEVLNKDPTRFDDRHLARVLLPIRLVLLNADHLDVINETR